MLKPLFRTLRSSLFAFAILIAFASGRAVAKNSDYISVAGDGTTFVQHLSGKTFTPIGYGIYWNELARENPKTWLKILTTQFKYLKSIGANSVRIWAEYPYFLDAPSPGYPYGTPDATYLGYLVKVIDMADSLDMHLDMTLNGERSKSGTIPPWFLAMTQDEQWNALAVEDSSVAKASAGASGSNAVFCYELASEQAIGDLEGHTLTQMVAKYMTQMDAAIHRYDTKHLISAGLVQSTTRPPAYWPETPAMYAPYVDLLAIHDYPGAMVIPGDTNVQSSIAQLNAFSGLGKPVLIEETSIIGCSAQDESQFLAQATLANGGVAAGIIGICNITPISELFAEINQGTLTISSASDTTPIVITTTPPISYAGGSYDISGVLGNTAANSGPLTVTNATNPAPIAIVDATNSTPITITTATDHGYFTGETVKVSGVKGNTVANGYWTITVTSPTQFTLANPLGSVIGNGDYIGGTGTTTPPILVTVAGTSTNLTSGARVSISGVAGNTGANGAWIVTQVPGSPTVFAINKSVGKGDYTNGGTVKWAWGLTKIDPTHFSLHNSISNGAYTGGPGTAELTFGSIFGEEFGLETQECIISPQDLGFEDVPISAAAPNDFTYGNTASLMWSFSAKSGTNGAGVTGNNSIFTATQAAPQGNQVAFLQGGGTISQKFYFVNGRHYAISFSAAQRAAQPSDENQTFRVAIAGGGIGAGSVITGGNGGKSGVFLPIDANYRTMTTGSFDIGSNPAGWYTIVFDGLATTDSMAFIDSVSVTHN